MGYTSFATGIIVYPCVPCQVVSRHAGLRCTCASAGVLSKFQQALQAVTLCSARLSVSLPGAAGTSEGQDLVGPGC
jgi:hypothetical protein